MNNIFSVIIPAYNSEDTITSCIESVVIKNYSSLSKTEIIIIDDFSKDQTYNRLKKLKTKYPILKIFKNKRNYGVSYTRNRGIKLARGEYIIFLDSDDNLEAGSLKMISSKINKKKNIDVIFGQFRKKTFPYSNKSLFSPIKEKCPNKEKLIKIILKKKFPLDECWPYIVKKKFLIKNKINFLNLRVAEDQLYVTKIFLKMQNILIVKKNFYNHNNFSGTLSDFMDKNSAKDCFKVLFKYCEIYSSLNHKKYFFFKKLLFNYIQGVFSMFTSLLIMRNKKEIKELSKIIPKDIKKYNFLIKYPENIYFFNFFQKKNYLQSLLNYKNEVIFTKKEKIDKFCENKKLIFIYCYSKFLGASYNIISLNKNLWKDKVKAILDENLNLSGKIFKGKKIISPKENFFNKNFFANHANLGIIINNHRDITIKKIVSFLKKNKIPTNKILVLRY